jgi:phage gp45-like
VSIGTTEGDAWQVAGVDDEQTETVDVYQGIGFVARPPAGQGAGVVVRPGGGDKSVVVAATNPDVTVEISPDEVAIYNSVARVVITSDSKIKLFASGVPEAAALLTDVQSLATEMAKFNGHLHTDPLSTLTGPPVSPVVPNNPIVQNPTVVGSQVVEIE